MMNNKQMKSFIATATSRALTVAVGRIYLRQTPQEHEVGQTIERNHQGFSKRTEHIGTYIGDWVFKGIPRSQMSDELDKLATGKPSRCHVVSGSFIEKARKLATIHSKQLSALAVIKAGSKVLEDRKVIPQPKNDPTEDTKEEEFPLFV